MLNSNSKMRILAPDILNHSILNKPSPIFVLVGRNGQGQDVTETLPLSSPPLSPSDETDSTNRKDKRKFNRLLDICSLNIIWDIIRDKRSLIAHLSGPDGIFQNLSSEIVVFVTFSHNTYSIILTILKSILSLDPSCTSSMRNYYWPFIISDKKVWFNKFMIPCTLCIFIS